MPSVSQYSFQPLSGSKDTIFDVKIERPDKEKKIFRANEWKEKREQDKVKALWEENRVFDFGSEDESD